MRPSLRTLFALALIAPLSALGCAAEAVGDEGEPGTTGDTSAESSEAITGSVPAGATLVTTRALNLRSAASTSASVRTVMPEGARLTALGGAAQSGYYRVSYRGQEGFAFGTYLDREGSGGGSTGGTTRRVTLLWQGTWEFLTRCDSFSNGRVTFACQDFLHPSRDFVDNGDWVAAPGSLQGSSNRLCGRRVEVCKGSVCRTATVVERSVESSASTWEGSPHLIRALGGDGGFTSCSHSWGTVDGVTITY